MKDKMMVTVPALRQSEGDLEWDGLGREDNS